MTVTYERTPIPAWQRDPDQSGWFAQYIEVRNAARAAATPALDEDGVEEEVEPDFIVLVPAESRSIEEVPTSPKGFWKRLLAAKGDWEVEAQETVTEHQASYWKNDSKKDSKRAKHQAGDLNRAEHTRNHLRVRAALRHQGQMVAAFMLTYDRDNGTTPLSWKMVGVEFWDMVNQERRFTKTTGEFEAWLSVFAPKLPSTTKKKAAPAAETNGENDD